MPEFIRKRLGERLVEEGVITQEQLADALEVHASTQVAVRDIIVEKGYVTTETLLQFMAKILGIPYMNNLVSKVIDPEVTSVIPEKVCRERYFFALYKWEDVLTVATADPFDVFALDDLRSMAQCKINPVLATREEIITAIDRCYGKKDFLETMIQDVTQEISDVKIIKRATDDNAGDTQSEALADAMEQEGPIIRLVDTMIVQAVDCRASDIHIEPEDESLRIRYRTDGILHNAMVPPKHLESFIISRIKIMAGMDIAIKRVPQDGRFGMSVKGKDIDVRVSSVPTVHGEKIVMRLLDQASVSIGLNQLGFSEQALNQINQLIQSPHGIVLISGPTGSGKTTTLYVALETINCAEKNIITIEDPVEYNIKGINQIQVNVKAGVTFATGLRAILRQDPDVIMVGEMRDLETAEISVQAALTGHLVFSTIHTNDAVSSIMRLIDMGIPPYLVASSVNGVLAQRLVRVLCPKCKEGYQPSEELLEELQRIGNVSKCTFYAPKGCEACSNTGYLGRQTISELMVLDKELRHLIHTGSSIDEIRDVAALKGMNAIWKDGVNKVMSGITSIEEVRQAALVDMD